MFRMQAREVLTYLAGMSGAAADELKAPNHQQACCGHAGEAPGANVHMMMQLLRISTLPIGYAQGLELNGAGKEVRDKRSGVCTAGYGLSLPVPVQPPAEARRLSLLAFLPGRGLHPLRSQRTVKQVSPELCTRLRTALHHIAVCGASTRAAASARECLAERTYGCLYKLNKSHLGGITAPEHKVSLHTGVPAVARSVPLWRAREQVLHQVFVKDEGQRLAACV